MPVPCCDVLLRQRGKTLVLENGELVIVLCGDLAAMLSYAANKKPGAFFRAGPEALAVQASVGCGGGI